MRWGGMIDLPAVKICVRVTCRSLSPPRYYDRHAPAFRPPPPAPVFPLALSGFVGEALTLIPTTTRLEASVGEMPGPDAHDVWCLRPSLAAGFPSPTLFFSLRDSSKT